MTDERTLSRRDSLRSIATTGTLVGGAGFGLGTASAHEDKKKEQGDKDGKKGKDEKGKKGKDEKGDYDERLVDFQACDAAFVRFETEDELPAAVRIVTYNAVDERIEHVAVTVTADRVRQFARYGTDLVYEFNVSQFYDRPADSSDRVLAVAIDGQRVLNPNDCATAPVDAKNDEDATIDLDALSYDGICVDTTRDTARFRVANDNERTVTIDYVVAGGEEGSVTIAGKSATYFEVGTTSSDGAATVYFYYGDSQLAVEGSNQDRECIPRDRLRLTARCIEICEGRSRFRVTNYESRPLTPTMRVAGTEGDAAVTVPGNQAVDLWVETIDPNAVVQLFYEGELVDSEGVPDERCENDVDVDADDIELKAVKYDDKSHDVPYGKFRATNAGKTNAPLEWRLEDDDAYGYVCVPAEGAAEFWVRLGEKAKDGVTVGLYHDDERVAEAKVDDTVKKSRKDGKEKKKEKKEQKGH
ncbi:hypothetical protein [Natronobacterium gregoryi]|nr:hypothetical protein [Natronobacterium gregoryi]